MTVPSRRAVFTSKILSNTPRRDDDKPTLDNSCKTYFEYSLTPKREQNEELVK
jgi:hypothetical protein